MKMRWAYERGFDDGFRIGAEKCRNISEELRTLQSDPSLEFCHRFAIVMECMVLSTRNDPYWTEATELIADYHEARNKWRESMGEPYVSGFGKI